MRRRTTTTPEVEHIALDALSVNNEYQRTVNERHVERIVSKFKPHLVNPIRVWKNGDAYEIIDGQHTAEVLRHMGWKAAPCFILNGKTTVEDAADTFVELNTGRKALRPLEIFQASLAAKQPLAVELDRIVRSFGLRIGTGGAINAVRALETIYKEGGASQLKKVLSVLTSTWDADDARRFDGKMLGGMHIFLMQNPSLEQDKIVEKLKRTSPTDILRKARTMGAGGGALMYHVAGEVERAYRRRGK